MRLFAGKQLVHLHDCCVVRSTSPFREDIAWRVGQWFWYLSLEYILPVNGPIDGFHTVHLIIQNPENLIPVCTSHNSDQWIAQHGVLSIWREPSEYVLPVLYGKLGRGLL